MEKESPLMVIPKTVSRKNRKSSSLRRKKHALIYEINTHQGRRNTVHNQYYHISGRPYKACAGLICAFILFIFFASPVLAGELIFGLDSTPERLIPIKIKSPQTFPVSMQIFQGLFDLNEEGKVIPCIVENWETKDNNAWFFHIRKGVFFHRSPLFEHGTREVTAKDVLYSLTRFCSADSYNAFLLTDSLKGAAEFNQGKKNHVTGLRLIDKYTIRIDLIRPERFFINRLSTALISVFPAEADRKEYTDKIGLSIAVGTGPYLLESKTASEVILKKNLNYWDKKNQPQLDKIIFRVIKTDQTRFVNLQRGKIDLMVLPNSLFATALNRDGTLKGFLRKKYQIKLCSTFNTHFIGINNSSITDVNLRRAMFWGTNRKAMINAILYGFAEETGGPVPPGINGYQPTFDQKLYDPEKATAFLSKSSYKGEPLEFLVHNIANSQQIGEIFQAQMADIGINIVLKKLDFSSVINRMIKGDCQLFSMFAEFVFSSPEPILINLFSSSKIPVPNIVHFSNPSVDEMLNSLYEMKDEKDSVKYCAKIETKAMKDAPAIFLYRQKYVVLYPGDMHGLEVSGNNHYFLERIRTKE